MLLDVMQRRRLPTSKLFVSVIVEEYQHQVTLATGDLPELLVRGDPQYLGQMLTNLIENGIKYTSGTGKRVYVELACEQQRWGVVRVQDDGPGISDEYLPYLFERFYRVAKARTEQQII